MRVIMKHLSIYNVLIATALLSLALLAACSSEEQTYDGPSYVMFTDSLNVCPLFQENNDYKVALSATKSVPYDRKFGIEILQTESNAIEGYHYSIKSNTVTIPAGELATSVEINGIYENIADDDSLNIRMRIVSLEDVEWPYYGVTANVRLQKMCPFAINNFTRYAVVQSSFLSEFKPYSTNKRLIMTDRVEGEDNSIMLHAFLCDGYDVKVTLDHSDPMVPSASVHTVDIIGSTQEFLGSLYNDNMLRITDYTAVPSTIFPCRDTVVLYSMAYVKDVGLLGAYVTVIRWISDAEAEDILHSGF